jgi:cyclopropane fatty-acyl-phospholipid synthase-like methyltransferase
MQIKRRFTGIKESETNAYCRIARYYDGLSRLVFGSSIARSQMMYIPAIPEESNVLILGGGTGWLLEDLLLKRPRCNYWFLDSSLEMIKMASRRVGYDKRVRFIHGKLDHIPEEVDYDVVIANFFFDQFSDQDLHLILKELAEMMAEHGVLIVTDFVGERVWQKIFLKIMYCAFTAIGAVVVTALSDWDALIRDNGFSVAGTERFYGGFIRSVFYRKELHAD